MPQVLVCANGAPALIEDTLAAALPVLVTVTFWAAVVEPTASLPNATEVGDAVSVALPPPELVPVPDRLTVLVTPPALTVSVPVRLPVAVGAKVTLTVHEPPAAIDEPQVLVWRSRRWRRSMRPPRPSWSGWRRSRSAALLFVPVATEPKLSAVGADADRRSWGTAGRPGRASRCTGSG